MSEADSRSRMLPTDRIVYSAIADRPPLRLPNNARMVVWVIVNVEEWDPTQTMPRTVLSVRSIADIVARKRCLARRIASK